jgi:hypothetical protein
MMEEETGKEPGEEERRNRTRGEENERTKGEQRKRQEKRRYWKSKAMKERRERKGQGAWKVKENCRSEREA